MLRVNRHDLAGLRGAEHQVAADDEGLFVRESEARAGRQCGKSRLEADCPGDAVEHHIRFDVVHQAHRIRCSKRGRRHTEAGCLLGKQVAVFPSDEPNDGESVGIRRDHLKGLCADAAGRPKDDDASHASIVVQSCQKPRSLPKHQQRSGLSATDDAVESG